jgi:TolB-like protein/Flp pilus assembly protein TadD
MIDFFTEPRLDKPLRPVPRPNGRMVQCGSDRDSRQANKQSQRDQEIPVPPRRAGARAGTIRRRLLLPKQPSTLPAILCVHCYLPFFLPAPCTPLRNKLRAAASEVLNRFRIASELIPNGRLTLRIPGHTLCMAPRRQWLGTLGDDGLAPQGIRLENTALVPAPCEFALGPFVLNTAAKVLLRDGSLLNLGERAVAILTALVRRPGQLVTKEQLMTIAWNSQAVEESNLTVQISILRRALAAAPGGESWIETLPRRGYRFTGPVSEPQETPTADPDDTPVPLPDKPSLAVLPFQNLSGDPSQEYFADGIVEDIITALSRIEWLFVIARNSSFTFKGRAVDVREVGRKLGVRYVLEGSVRRSANRVRVTAQLIDTASNAHIWADRFDGDLEDVFELQDLVTESVAGTIEPKLRHAEIERSRRKPTESLRAYDYFLRALANFHLATKEPNLEAVRLLERAIAIDPGYTAAYGLAAYCYAFRKGQGWMADRTAESAEGLRMARLAIAGNHEDATPLYMGSMASSYLGGDLHTAATVMDRALSLNPNLAGAWHLSGWIRMYLEDGETAVKHFSRALRLNPLDPTIHILSCGTAFAWFAQGNLEEALRWADKSLREGPVFLAALRCKVTVLGLMGRIREAELLIPRLLELEPNLRCSVVHTLVPWGAGMLARYADGLRAAGIPE